MNRPLPSATVQARFHAISKAYDVLRGKSRLLPSGDTEPVQRRTDYHELSTAMWKAKQRKKGDLSFGAPVISDRWKDRMMLGAVIFVSSPRLRACRRLLMEAVVQAVGAFVAQNYSTRRQVVASAKEYSEARSDYYGDMSKPSPRRMDDSLLDGEKGASKPP